jgi:transposase
MQPAQASIHHAEDSVELIESIGALVIFLPPYSPDMNPIEETFSAVKSYLKANEAVMQATDDIEDVITAAFASITSKQCQAWIRDSGYC